MNQCMPRGLLAAALLVPAFAMAQSTDPLPATTALVGVAGAPLPTTETFTIDTAQDLVVTLTDAQSPAAMDSASVVISQGATLAGSATLATPAISTTVDLPGAVGSYTLRVIGTPNASVNFGTYTVCVAPKATPTNCIQNASLAGNVTAQPTAPDPTVSTVSIPLTVTQGGTYTVTFADDAFPAPLAIAPNLAIFQGSTPVSLGIASGATVALNPGTYTLLSVAQADATAQAGLYGINIAIAGVATVLDVSLPVGKLTPAAQRDNAAAQTLSLTVTDFQFPSALTSAAATATAGATLLATATSGAGAVSFAAPVATVNVWNYAAVGTASGSYEVDLASATSTLMQSVFGANASGAASLVYGFVTPSSLAAADYQANLNDFQFPASLQAVQLAVAQGGAIIAQSSSVGALNFTAPTQAPVVVLVSATPPANGNGLFDVNVQTAGTTPQIQFDQVQGVSASGVFTTQSVAVGVSGSFDVSLTDLQFPAQFQNLAVLVSSGGSVLGKIYGGGTFSFNASPATYLLSFVASPGTGQQYGMYGLQIVNSGPAVTLSASPTAVTTGQATTLSWTTTNATSCTGSGTGFDGAQNTGSGSLSVSVAATTTYTLTCTGAGGSATQSVAVTATAAPASSGHGGGGALDIRWALVLFLLVAARRLALRGEAGAWPRRS